MYNILKWNIDENFLESHEISQAYGKHTLYVDVYICKHAYIILHTHGMKATTG
jgi:hypothetical protein